MANALAEEAFKQSFPILGSALSFWTSAEQKQIQIELNNWVLDYLKILDQRIDNLPEQITPGLNRLAALAFERIFWGASEKKAKRFAAVIAHAFGKDEQTLENAASYHSRPG